jgi:hypothetical protein
MFAAAAGIAGLIFLCWLVFTLAVYALPFFVAVSAGMLALDSGAGTVGVIFVGIGAGTFTLLAGQFFFAAARSPIAHALVAAVFAVPAGIAGYHVAYGLIGINESVEAWRQVLGVAGALVTGAVAWSRLSAPHRVVA